MSAIRLRQVINFLNLSTLVGLVLAKLGGARLHRGPDHLVLATGYHGRLTAPRAPAVTVGNVVLLRMELADLAGQPTLLRHEGRHATQYAFWIGPFGFLPAYLLASGWSWLRTRNFALGNAFEIRAGLVDGGYLPRPSEPEPDR